jgi:hypothetical protein
MPRILARGRRYGAVVAGDDDALMAFVRRIAAGDDAGITAALRDRPDLATMALGQQGATRQRPHDYFLDEIAHHVYRGDTALHVAAAASRTRLVHELIAGGAVVDARNRRGATPLHYAVDGGPGAPHWDPAAQAGTVRALLALGADRDTADKNGTTPLLRAIRNRCSSAVAALLDGGADPHATNAKGSNAMDLASWTTGRGGTGSPEALAQQEQIVSLLAARGVRATG